MSEFTDEELDREEWRPVVGWPGYEVSDLGRVRSYRRKGPTVRIGTTAKLLKPNQRRCGHLTVILSRGSEKPQLYLVHRLVLEAFVGPCPEKHEGCHRNGVPHDNRLSNLYWGTRGQNKADAIKHGALSFAKLTPADIPVIWERLRNGEGPASIARDYPAVSMSQISSIKQGATWRHITQHLEGFPLIDHKKHARDLVRPPEEFRTIDTEHWRDVPDYPRCQVSNLGRVRLLAVRSDRRRGIEPGDWYEPSLRFNIDGYQEFKTLNSQTGKGQLIKVHRCILLAFAGPAPEGMVACHDDGDKLNNTAANLRWDTLRSNSADRFRHAAATAI